MKFVNLDNYTVVKEKEGWLTVKDNKGKKEQRWVVLRENTLLCLESPDDTTPVISVPNVDTSKFEITPKKADAFSIKVIHGKAKLG